MAYKKDVFILHLDGAPQAVSTTTATWNGLCSEMQCTNVSNATVTLVAAEFPGTILSVRKISGAGTVTINYPSATALATLTANVNDTAVFVWSGTTWDIVALDVTPDVLNLGTVAVANKANPVAQTNRTDTVVANAMIGTITTSSAALAAATEASFTLSNSFIATSGSKIFLTLAGVNAASFGGLGVSGVSTGTCTIRYKNDSAASVSLPVEINFLVIN
jgi:hypothetical protein